MLICSLYRIEELILVTSIIIIFIVIIIMKITAIQQARGCTWLIDISKFGFKQGQNVFLLDISLHPSVHHPPLLMEAIVK